jgi:hypothetical protein
MRRLRLLTPRPFILPAIILPCPNVDQPGEQKSLAASDAKKHATLDRPSQYILGLVNDQSGGGVDSEL